MLLATAFLRHFFRSYLGFFTFGPWPARTAVFLLQQKATSRGGEGSPGACNTYFWDQLASAMVSQRPGTRLDRALDTEPASLWRVVYYARAELESPRAVGNLTALGKVGSVRWIAS